MFSLLLAFPLFMPPSSWEVAQTKKPSSYVLVSFVSKDGNTFRPSMNLSTEEVDVTLKEYVKAVKEINVKEPNTSWRDLGTIDMKAGQGRLAEISSKTPHGEVKTLQAFFINKKTAYILTAASLKKEMPALQELILTAFRSFSFEDSLSGALKSEKQQSRMKEMFSGLGSFSSESDLSLERQKKWDRLQRDIPTEFPEMGGYWHFLALKEGLSKINAQ